MSDQGGQYQDDQWGQNGPGGQDGQGGRPQNWDEWFAQPVTEAAPAAPAEPVPPVPPAEVTPTPPAPALRPRQASPFGGQGFDTPAQQPTAGYPQPPAPGYPPQAQPGYPPQAAAPGYPAQAAPGYSPQAAAPQAGGQPSFSKFDSPQPSYDYYATQPAAGGPAWGNGQPAGGPAWGSGQPTQQWNQAQPTQQWGPDQPTQQWGQPQPTQPWGQPSPWGPGQSEVLAIGAPRPPRRRRGTLIAAGVTTVALLGGLGAGGAWVYANFGGGGDQPEQHLPASAAMALRVDLDPSLSQKVDAIRFATKFPTSRNLSWDSKDNDPRKWLYEQLTKDTQDAPAWSEVEPWLGKRAAVAVSPSADGKQALTMFVVQVTDEASAKSTVSKVRTGGKPVGVAVANGWMLVSDTAEHATALQAEAAKTPLSGSATFTKDVKDLGDQGIASLWFDSGALGKLASTATASLDSLGGLTGGALGSGSGDGSADGSGDTSGDTSALGGTTGTASQAFSALRGHGSVALRFDGPNLELAGRVNDYDPQLNLVWGATPATVNAPTDSVAVFSLGGFGKQLVASWDKLLTEVGSASASKPDELIGQIQLATGLQLPKDLEPMFGDQFEVVVRSGKGGTGTDVGVRVETASPDGKRVFGSLSTLLAETGTKVSQKSFSGGWVLASNAATASAIAQGGPLATSDRFKNAVPDADGASAVAFVDLGKAFALSPDPARSATDQQAMDALDAVGFSSKKTSDTSASFAIRLTTR